jgi:dGTPase
MEDVLRATSRRLSCISTSAVRNANDFLVNHSEEMQADVNEIWDKLQAGRLHQDRRVVGANMAAARIVSELTLAFSLVHELVDRRFREEHEPLENSDYMRFYEGKVGKSVKIRTHFSRFFQCIR